MSPGWRGSRLVVAHAILCSIAAASCAASETEPCGSAYFVDGYWALPVAGDGSGDWYDPGDGWTASGGGGDDGATDTTGDPSDTGDPSGTGDNGSGGDGSGGDGSGGDGSEALTKLHLNDIRSREPASDGCYSCTVICALDDAARTERGAVGASSAGFDDACRAAMGSLQRWAHHAAGSRVAICRSDPQPDGSPARAPATPTVPKSSAHR